MCGRYQLDYDINQLIMAFDAENRYIGYGIRNEIFPTDPVAIITRDRNKNYIDCAKWGFKTHFSNRPLINARGETVNIKNSFKTMFKNSRCIIPASSFFEWHKNPDGSKTKFKISTKNFPIFGMAGLYCSEQDELGNISHKCTIITTSANEGMSSIHDRMPVILPSTIVELWLDNSNYNIPMLKELLKPYNGDLELLIVS